MLVDLEPDYGETFLLPPAVEDWVGADHPVRFIREYVDCQDLKSLGVKLRASAVGNPSYSRSMLLKLWLYGYFFHCRSSRKLERACCDSMGAIWLSGRMVPDHNTLWRFWSDNRKLIEKLFKQSVRVACKAGLVGLVFHALDGTKLLSAASRRSALHKQDLAKALEVIDELVSKIAEQIETAEQADHPALKLELADVSQRRIAVAKALEELNAQEATRTHPGDPDAQMMKTNSGRVEWAYNGQVVVDDKHGIVVAADVSSEATDDHHLKSMLDQTRENAGSVAERTLADAAYGHSEAELAKVEETGYAVVTARPKRENNTYDAAQFQFDRQQKTLVCPAGHALRSHGTSRRSQGRPGRLMEFICKRWKECPNRDHCCGRTREGELRARRVRIGPHREAADRQRQAVTKEQRALLMHRRLGTVEPYFARVRWLAGFTRFSFRGREKVRTQWRMFALVNNLKVLMKQWTLGQLRLSRAWMTDMMLES